MACVDRKMKKYVKKKPTTKKAKTTCQVRRHERDGHAQNTRNKKILQRLFVFKKEKKHYKSTVASHTHIHTRTHTHTQNREIRFSKKRRKGVKTKELITETLFSDACHFGILCHSRVLFTNKLKLGPKAYLVSNEFLNLALCCIFCDSPLVFVVTSVVFFLFVIRGLYNTYFFWDTGMPMATKDWTGGSSQKKTEKGRCSNSEEDKEDTRKGFNYFFWDSKNPLPACCLWKQSPTNEAREKQWGPASGFVPFTRQSSRFELDVLG